MTKSKILVIPSWYPNKELTAGGSQFREQAEFFQERYDVRVLFGTKSKLSSLKWIKQNGLKHASPLSQETTQTGLIEHRFEYKSFFKDERHLIGAMIQGYREALAGIIGNGWKPDLIHARCTDPAGVIASHLSKIFSIPFILSEHQKFSLGYSSEYFDRLMRRAIRSAALVTVVSQHQLRSIATNYLFPKMIVTGNLIDGNLFSFAPPKRTANIFNILTVMYPHPIKDPETFFKSIGLLREFGHENINVTVIGKKVGTKEDNQDFLDLADKYKVRELCHFLPNVPRSDMPSYYADSHVFVSTAVVETFGIAVREAMAVGRPVVCTASGGVDDDIYDFNGFKTNIYDYQAVADALIKIKTGLVQFDPTQIRDYALSRYGRTAYLERFSAIFDSALKKEETS